jgi:S-adenosylmethionine hydrolase
VEVENNEYFITPDNVGMLKLAKEANTILVTIALKFTHVIKNMDSMIFF